MDVEGAAIPRPVSPARSIRPEHDVSSLHSTVVRYIEAGTLDARRLPGGHWRIRRIESEKLLRDDSESKPTDGD